MTKGQINQARDGVAEGKGSLRDGLSERKEEGE